MDRLLYYKKVLEKNPGYDRALSKCMEELIKVPLFSDADKQTETKELKDNITHYIHTWAPVLTEFAEWVLESARKDGIKTLYFLSRDAWPVYRAAMKIADSKATKNAEYPTLRYLRVSRYALRVPEMAVDRDDFLNMMFLSGIDVTMRKILSRGALDEKEMFEFTRIIGYADDLDNIIARPQILNWKEKAEKHKEELWEIVKKKAEERLPNVISYFEQEGMFSGEKIAVVDSGWVGTTQRSLLRLLNSVKPGTELNGYYFGLYEIPKDMKQENYHAFYFEPKGSIKRKVYFSNCLFEAVSSEAAGMTLEYRKENYLDRGDVIVPVTADYGSLNQNYLDTMQPYLELFAKVYSEECISDNGVGITEEILSRLMARPDELEASNYGSLKFCDDVLEGDAQDIAAQLDYSDICNLRLLHKTVIWAMSKLGIKAPAIHESGWIYGSIVRCGKNIGFSLFCARIYNYLMYIRKSI
ncbi:hypothetical protein [Butyrivibrio sp. FC2001]|uniref:hypothetical protein n=1 Tax=Butyrivibrio sp. FC2001 TaxID=1280671 RepID=UPI000426AB41|nr:hypothetical protein [Butyrivibrio sp. FC2001]